MKKLFLLCSFLLFGDAIFAAPWVADLGNGNYKNPVLYADYSDPDIVKVGTDFYMVASSFTAMPGIPVLHSKDLVNWEIIGHVYEKFPFEKYQRPQHGLGSWAPSIQYHNKTFYVYFCTPDLGLFVATTKNPTGSWKLSQVASVELWEDPAAFWDDDGQAYLVRGKVRADILYLHKLSEDGMHLLDDGKIIYKNIIENPTIEGPKLFKKDGYYYIFSPAGGVGTGWQTVLRSKKIDGPYEAKKILQQGSTAINGPHQGGFVHLDSDEWWFMHFQDAGVYGRVVHLQPMSWKNDWPLLGENINAEGVGEPVLQHKKPDVGAKFPIHIPQTSDEFNSDSLGLQWQWQANPDANWYSLNRAEKNHLRLYTVSNPTQFGNLRFVPNLLLQKFSSPAFTATTKIIFHPNKINDKAGLVVMGQEWAYIALYQTAEGLRLGLFKGIYEQYDDATKELASVLVDQNQIKKTVNSYTYFLRVAVEEGGRCQFFYSRDGDNFAALGEKFQATKGVWIGAKLGLFSLNPSLQPSFGFMDVDWFRVE